MEDSSTNNQQLPYVIITGAAGFIGSCMVQYLNEKNYENLILADDFLIEEKRKNWTEKKYAHTVERNDLFDWLDEQKPKIDVVIHLGARTDTTESNYEILNELNVEYSQDIWNYCTAYNVPLIYASSAATYGAGGFGYNDDEKEIEKLQPLNPYGISKNEFDKWALQQQNHPPFWAGLKFFNVYGPNEYHKARMASVIFHSFNQIKNTGIVKLFKSHKKGFRDGEQLRDFIYVKDVVKVIFWMMKNAGSEQSGTGNQQSATSNEQHHQLSSINQQLVSGIYNLGTGHAETFNQLVNSTFKSLDLQTHIEYINMPEDIREKYQYFTEASMKKLRNAGYEDDFYNLENGVADYVKNYLSNSKTW